MDTIRDHKVFLLVLGIRRWREGRGVSQRALAKGLNVDPATLARWESGLSRPSKRCLVVVDSLFARETK
ncbi:MAG: helix-turn-helix domain-containing protein [Cyanobacteria bacterium]|nr:helix-turn-helix domain-containing protein [Cyanobacteriota bacterium]